VPIVTHSPQGQVQTFLGNRTDDVELFRRGDEQGLLALMGAGTWSPEADGAPEEAMVMVAGKPAADIAGALISGHAAEFGQSPDLGGVRLGDIDDVRDQWCHAYSRAEQVALIRWAGEARLVNRLPGRPRSVLFLGGDLHAGGIFELASAHPAFRAPCLFASGISRNSPALALGVTVDEDFEVAPGISAKLHKVVTGYNFGVVQVVPTGATPALHPTLVHEGEAWTVGLDLGLHEFPFGRLPGPSLPTPFL
jgi:hypothetical protein